MSIFVVIPTYNERENLLSLIQEIRHFLPHADILVVDDHSPDGTGKLVEKMRDEVGSRIHLLSREKKEGLGRAYLAGFHYALENGAQKIFQMDADHSHSPEALPTFLEMSNRFDLVVGSRYVQGGRTLGWPWRRRYLSRAANFYARTLLGLPINDVTTGYRCFNRRVLERINLSRVQSLGYGFQVEMIFKAFREGFSIAEHPIVFKDRQVGKSKMGLHVAWEGAAVVWKIRKYSSEHASSWSPSFSSSSQKS